MKQRLRKCFSRPLLCFYALAAVLTILYCLACAALDAAAYANGSLTTVTIDDPAAAVQQGGTVTVSDILITDAGVWASAGTDPQLYVTADQTIRTVRVEGVLSADRAEGYYVSAGEWSLRRRVVPSETGEGLLFFFPRGSGSTVRIDPTSMEATDITVTRIVINEPQPVAQYFRLRGEQVFALLVLPALFAAAADWCGSLVQTLRKRKENV